MERDYFSSKADHIENDFHSADGWDDVYADDWNMNDTEIYADGGVQAPTSNPFIVTLYNSTAGALSDVSFLHAVTGIGATNYGVTAGVTVAYDVSGVNYEDFLRSLMTQSVKIGVTYIECSSTTQLSKSIKIETNNATGSGKYGNYKPVVNPFQNQTTSVVLPQQFILNGWTKFTLSTLASYTSVTFNLYPMAQSSTIAQLKDGKAQRYADPKISGMRIIK